MYKLETSKSNAYAKEVKKIIHRVENNEMKTYKKEEFENEMSAFREELKEKCADN